MNLKNYYFYYPKGFSEKTCDNLIRAYSDFKFDQGTVQVDDKQEQQGEEIENSRNSNVFFTGEPELYQLLNPFIHHANEKAGWNFQWDWTESCQIAKYKKNQFYNWHIDQFQDPYPDNDKHVSHRNKIRKLSTVVALSNGSEYEGGDFEMDFRNNRPVKNAKEASNIDTISHLRKKGTVIVFPSFVWHRVTPVLSGTRYSLVSWSLGDPFK
jgi:PKHD-type hydroxylase